MALSALALLLIASPGVFGWYKRNLAERRNYGRWIEYSITSSLMIVLITMICGITDIAAMIAIFGVNASMILFGAAHGEVREARQAQTGCRSSSAASRASSPGSRSWSTCGARA